MFQGSLWNVGPALGVAVAGLSVLLASHAARAAQNLPSGGPAYPLSAPGVRVKLDFGQNISFLFAIFNGDPAGPCAGDLALRRP
jgi:porin